MGWSRATIDLAKKLNLYVLITDALSRGDWLETAEAALANGAAALQLREKSLPDASLLALPGEIPDPDTE